MEALISRSTPTNVMHDGSGDGDDGSCGYAMPEQHAQGVISPALQLVISNDIIVEKLSEYLSLSDLKYASLACRDFSKAFRGTRAFQNNAMLIISRETAGEAFLRDTFQPWKIVSVDLSLPHEVLDIISDILGTVEVLRVTSTRVPTSLEQPVLIEFLTRLCVASKNLRHLELQENILGVILHDFLSNPEVQTRFKKLLGLEFFIGSRCDPNMLDYSPFPRNLMQLTQLPMSLECFKLEKIEALFEDSEDYTKFVPQLLVANKDSLRKLQIPSGIWTFEDMRIVHCPNLRVLNIQGCPSHANSIREFIINQPLLEGFSIKMRNYFPEELFDAIIGRTSRLRKLEINTKEFELSDCVYPSDRWNFLADIENLKCFSITQPHKINSNHYGKHYGNGYSLMKALSSSTKLRRLKIRITKDFWLDVSTYENITGDSRLSLLLCFQNLTELMLPRCENSLDDESLQCIIKHFTKLKKLQFTHCSEITDFGITGVQNGNAIGTSLSNLRGLGFLSIRCCYQITFDGLLDSLKLPYLKVFDFLPATSVTKSFVVKLVLQNPALEVLQTFVSRMEDDYVTWIRDLQKSKTRINKFVNLNDCAYEAYDSDSDAECYYNEGDSDFSNGLNELGFGDSDFNDSLEDFNYDSCESEDDF